MDRHHERILVPPQIPKPLPSHLRFELTSALLSDSAIPTIQSTLYDTSQDVGWIDAVRDRAKQLISTGQATSSHQVTEILLKEARARSKSRATTTRSHAHHRQTESDGQGSSGLTPQAVDIKFPDEAIKEGMKVVRTALEDIADVRTS